MADNATAVGSSPVASPTPASDALAITANVVSDNQLLTALWLNLVLGAVCFLAFCLLQRSVFPRHYRFRLLSDSVTVKPRPLPTIGWRSLWQWLVNAIFVRDSEILQSSGMDAMVMIKALAIGVQLLGPPAVLGCLILIPINYTQRGLQQEANIAKSQLMQLTIAALPQGSPVMWVHFIFLIVYNAYAMAVLWWHYKQYLIVRHHYLMKGDDPNFWIAMTQEAESKYISRKVNRMLKRLQGVTEAPPPVVQPPVQETPLQRSTSSNRRSSNQPHGLFSRINAFLHHVPFSSHHSQNPPAADRLGNRSGSEPLPEALRSAAASPGLNQASNSARYSSHPNPLHAAGWMMGPSAGNGFSQPTPNPLHLHLEPTGSFNALVSPKLPPLKRRSLAADDAALGTITEAPEHSSGGARRSTAGGNNALARTGSSSNPMHGLRPPASPKLQTVGSLTLSPMLSPFATSADAHAAAASIASAGVQADLEEVRITIHDHDVRRVGSDSALVERAGGVSASGSPMAPGHRRNKSTGSGKNVVYHWWKELPSDAFERTNSAYTDEGASSDDGDDLMQASPAGGPRTLLAVPSVRFRKTINTEDQRGRPVAVNAQHYAVLVTDVEQGPYPEIQAELEAKRRRGCADHVSSMLERATDYVTSNRIMCCGYSRDLFKALDSSSSEEEDEEAPMLPTQWGVDSILRMDDVEKDPAAPFEHIADAAMGIKEARRALQALATQATEDSGITSSSLSSEDASRTLKRLSRVEARLSRLAAERERHNALSRDHSTLFSVAARNSSMLGSRPGSVLGLERRSINGLTGFGGGAGPNSGPSRANSVHGGNASRAGSVLGRRSMAVAGAMVGVPESMNSGTLGSNHSSPEPQRPRPMRASSEVMRRPKREYAHQSDDGGGRVGTMAPRVTRITEGGGFPGGMAGMGSTNGVERSSGESDASRMSAPQQQEPPRRHAPPLLQLQRPWQHRSHNGVVTEGGGTLDSLASLRLAKSETSVSTPPSSPRPRDRSPGIRFADDDSGSETGSVIVRSSGSPYTAGPSHLYSAQSSPDPWEEVVARPLLGANRPPGTASDAHVQFPRSPMHHMPLHGGSRLHTASSGATMQHTPAGIGCQKVTPEPIRSQSPLVRQRGAAGAAGASSSAQGAGSAAAGNGFNGLTSLRSRPRGWALVKRAMRTGALQKLLDSDNYSVVTATFKRLFPDDFDRAVPVLNHKEVDMLLMKWETAVAALERAEYKRDLTGREPTKPREKCDCCGPRIELIPYIQEKIAMLEDQIEAARVRVRATAFTPSWFVLFKSQKAASIAASARFYSEDNRKFQVHAAPGPEEVNWQHLWMSWRERDIRGILTWPFTVLIVVMPITLITSSVGRLDYLLCADPQSKFYWDWYCVGRLVGNNALAAFIRSFLTGWLPSLLLNLWLVMVLPRVIYLIVQSEGGCYSLSRVERRVGAIFFYWDIFNVFLQGVIGSTFFQQIQSIIVHPESLLAILGAALPDSSNFFMQFIALRAFFLVWLRLCIPHGGVWQNWCHYLWCPACCCATCNTERDKSLTYGPRTPRYGFEMGHVLMMYLIALAFSVVAPLLVPFAVVWFAFAWVAWRHNLSYVYTRKYESGGLMWPYLFARICVCLIVNQVFTFCVFITKGAYVQAFLLISFMPLMTLTFYRNCKARFEVGVTSIPLDLAERAPKANVPPLAYIPPPLQERSWGWYPEWNKIWDGWGMPRYGL